MDGMVFGEFMEHLTKILKKALEDENKDDTLSMHSLFKPQPETERPEDEEEFLRLHDGNYLSQKEKPSETPAAS